MLSDLISNPGKFLRESRRSGRAFLRRSLERTANDLASDAVGRGTGVITIPDDKGYLKFSAAELAGGDGFFRRMADQCKAWMTDPSRVGSEKKEFLINMLRGEDLFENRDILKLALHDEILAGVTRYLGQVPRLFNLYMWWSPPNETLKGSQLFHYDHRDTRQAKVFININDVTDESGPLHFIPADDCLKVDAKVGYSQDKHTDEEVYSAVPESSTVVAKGSAGTGYIVDTARCLHYGSRGNTLDRLILMASFARTNSVEPGGGCKTLDPVRKRLAKELYANDPVRTFVLTAPK